MKNILFIGVLVIFIASLVSILYKRKKTDYTGLEVTDIRISKKLIDVGERMLNDSVSATYMFYNTGKTDLVIMNVEPDCHCTIPEFSQERIKPNDSVAIRLKYDSTIPGVFQSSAMVTTNAKQTPTLLIMRGRITVLSKL